MGWPDPPPAVVAASRTRRGTQESRDAHRAEVVAYSIETSTREAADRYDYDTNTVNRWRREKGVASSHGGPRPPAGHSTSLSDQRKTTSGVKTRTPHSDAAEPIADIDPKVSYTERPMVPKTQVKGVGLEHKIEIRNVVGEWSWHCLGCFDDGEANGRLEVLRAGRQHVQENS